MVAYRRPTGDVAVAVVVVDVVGRRGRVHLLLRRLPDRFSRLSREQGAARGLARLRERERKTIAEDLFSLSRVCRRDSPDAVTFTRNNNRHHENRVTLRRDKTSPLGVEEARESN